MKNLWTTIEYLFISIGTIYLIFLIGQSGGSVNANFSDILKVGTAVSLGTIGASSFNRNKN